MMELGVGRVSFRRIVRKALSQQRGNERSVSVLREMGSKEGKEAQKEISKGKALSQRMPACPRHIKEATMMGTQCVRVMKVK